MSGKLLMTSELIPFALASIITDELVHISLLVRVDAYSHVFCREARCSQDQTHAALQYLASDDLFLVVLEHNCHCAAFGLLNLFFT